MHEAGRETTMAYKFKFFAQPVISNIRTFCEAALVEFTIGLICAVFAYASYGVFIHLFVACVVISIACFCLSIYNLYSLFYYS
jgi:hypothetical protein